jgi:hypothetical protein
MSGVEAKTTSNRSDSSFCRSSDPCPEIAAVEDHISLNPSTFDH